MGRIARLEAIYAEIPDMVDCKGQCYESCGPIGMNGTELRRIRENLPSTVPGEFVCTTTDHTCPALSADGRCTVYDVRPLICRLWGTIPAMPCPFGCKPERWLEGDELDALLKRYFLLDPTKYMTAPKIADAMRYADAIETLIDRRGV